MYLFSDSVKYNKLTVGTEYLVVYNDISDAANDNSDYSNILNIISLVWFTLVLKYLVLNNKES